MSSSQCDISWKSNSVSVKVSFEPVLSIHQLQVGHTFRNLEKYIRACNLRAAENPMYYKFIKAHTLIKCNLKKVLTLLCKRIRS